MNTVSEAISGIPPVTYKDKVQKKRKVRSGIVLDGVPCRAILYITWGPKRPFAGRYRILSHARIKPEAGFELLPDNRNIASRAIIERFFPEFVDLNKWNGYSAGNPVEPMFNEQQIQAAMFFCRDTDGLGRKRGDVALARYFVFNEANGYAMVLCNIEPASNGEKTLVPRVFRSRAAAARVANQICGQVFEEVLERSPGGFHDFNAVRRMLQWHDASDEELKLPKEKLRALMLKKLPEIAACYKAFVEKLGFTW